MTLNINVSRKESFSAYVSFSDQLFIWGVWNPKVYSEEHDCINTGRRWRHRNNLVLKADSSWRNIVMPRWDLELEGRDGFLALGLRLIEARSRVLSVILSSMECLTSLLCISKIYSLRVVVNSKQVVFEES